MDFWAALPTTAEAGGARLFRNLIERSVFFSETLPTGERAAAYQEQCAGTTARMTPLAEPVRAHAVSYAVPPVRIHVFDNSPFLFERTRAAYEADGLDFIAIQHIVGGEALGRFDGRQVRLEEGCAYAIDMSRICTIEETAPVRLMLLILPRPLAAACLGDLDDIHGRVATPEATKAYSAAFHDLAPRLEAWPRAEAASVFEALRPALSAIMGKASAPAEPKLLARVRVFVDANLADRSLTPQRIADGLGVSRTALYETLKSVNGIERFVFARRLARVHARLIDEQDKATITVLAEQHGFSSPDHLTKLFRQTYGVAPSALRAAANRDN